MTQRIHHLSSLTIDKIAAGEVIDVPSSCIKELIENSIDAGATEIIIEIRLGGRELIRVTDNGCGMGREDVLCSIERHATSKLSAIEDLESLSSRGFRGEALSSIVAISRVTICSAEKKDGSRLCPATTLKVAGGTVESVTETTRAAGTTIEVTDLFYNVPARRKFLKSPAKDTADILKMVTVLSLTAPAVTFRLMVDGHQAFCVESENDLSCRIRSVLKEPFLSHSTPVLWNKDGLTIEGLIVDPGHLKANRSGQYLIVNGRFVQSLPISYSVKGAYGATCDERHHPQFVLCMTLDPAVIDVNVHPQKREIRFADEEWVRVMTQEAVSEALFGKTLFSSEQRTVVETLPSAINSIPLCIEKGPEQQASVPDFFCETLSRPAECCAVIGEVALIRPHGELLISVPHEALLVLDLKEAMRAVLFREMTDKERPTVPLLIPLPLECSQEEAALVQQNLSDFLRLGFSIRPFGKTTFLVESLPQGFQEADVISFIFEAIHSGVFAVSSGREEARQRRLVSLYVSSMKAMRGTITSETALSVFSRWVHVGSPLLSPEGSRCCSVLEAATLREFLSRKGGL